MLKLGIPFFTVVAVCLLSGLLLVQAQDDTAPNWCYEGGPWGDGRCNSQPTAQDNDNFWECGYWNAKVDAGELTLAQLEATNAQCFDGYVAVRYPEWITDSDNPVSDAAVVNTPDGYITEYAFRSLKDDEDEDEDGSVMEYGIVE